EGDEHGYQVGHGAPFWKSEYLSVERMGCPAKRSTVGNSRGVAPPGLGPFPIVSHRSRGWLQHGAPAGAAITQSCEPPSISCPTCRGCGPEGPVKLFVFSRTPRGCDS